MPKVKVKDKTSPKAKVSVKRSAGLPRTLVNFILDQSGSMASVKEATISGFNEYINTLKQDKNSKYNWSFTLFDTQVYARAVNLPLEDVPELTANDYNPDNMTALYDAVCSTIIAAEKTLEPKMKVLTVIMTDGAENSSKEFTQEQLKAKIKELEAKGNWSFVFLGANQDSWLAAGKMGIPTMNTSNFAFSSAGVKNTMRTMAANTATFSAQSAGNSAQFFSKEDQNNLQNTK